MQVDRQALFNKLADEGEITVGGNGRCERDAGRCATQLYSRFSQATRKDFSRDRPARPIFYFDGTGGSLGRGIGHAELGSADFAGDCKQSRATLNPLNMWPGNDHALPLRENLDETMRSFNALSAVWGSLCLTTANVFHVSRLSWGTCRGSSASWG